MKARAPAILAYAAVSLAASAWGTWPLILRHAESIAKMHATLEGTVVMAVMTVVSGLVMMRDRLRVRASLRDWIGIGWLGVGDAGNFILFFGAYQTTSVAIAVLTHYLTPILVALAAPFALRERATRKSMIAVAVSFAGLVLLLAPWSAERHAQDWKGAAFGAGSAVFYAANVLVNKRLGRVFSTSELMFYHGLLSLPLLAACVPREAWAVAEPRALLVVAAGGVGPGALAGLLFVWGLRHLPASHTSTLTLLEPLVAVLCGAAVLHEALGLHAAAGGALILGGAAVVMRAGTRA